MISLNFLEFVHHNDHNVQIHIVYASLTYAGKLVVLRFHYEHLILSEIIAFCLPPALCLYQIAQCTV